VAPPAAECLDDDRCESDIKEAIEGVHDIVLSEIDD
jgi:hypothetical protein